VKKTINIFGLRSENRLPVFMLLEQEANDHNENLVEIARRHMHKPANHFYDGIMLTIGDNFSEIYSRHQLRTA
jgi:hypothetical protein